MKIETIDQVIDDIILKSPYGGKLWQHRQKQKYKTQNDSKNEDSKPKQKDEPTQDHPHQTYFDFGE